MPILGIINSFVQGGKLKKMAGKINPVNAEYKENPEARKRLSLAEMYLNARNPATTYAERNVQGNEANQMAQIGDLAGDSSQALAYAAGVHGNTNNAYGNIQNNEVLDQQRRYKNYTDAQEGIIQEGDKTYADKLRDYQEKMNLKNSYLAASMQNKQAAFNGIDSLAVQLGGMALTGGFSGLGKKRA
jgi:hypothetical protein